MIIKSILDTDLYKFTTSYAYMKLFPQAVGTFEFKDRDNTEYTEEFVEQLRIELYNLAQVRLTSDEFEFMNSIRFIPRHYWEWLSQFTFNPSKVQIFLDEEKHLHIVAKDYLYKVSLYEVPILAMVSELRNRMLGYKVNIPVMLNKLESKIKRSNQSGIPLIGRSLPIKNKNDEFDVSKLVGEAFCDEFKVCPMTRLYHAALKEVYQVENMERHESTYTIEELEQANGQTKVANGNIQARLRMMFLYNLASIHKGLVMSTDNQTEYQLGFWTIHGDVGDFDPIQDLWKTEVYELARWLVTRYQNIAEFPNRECWENRAWKAIVESIKLIPTDGLGISNSDLEQIGAKDYATVDDILQTATNNIFDSTGRWVQPLMEKYSEDVVVKVLSRHVASEFKRKKAPIYIPRKEYEND